MEKDKYVGISKVGEKGQIESFAVNILDGGKQDDRD